MSNNSNFVEITLAQKNIYTMEKTLGNSKINNIFGIIRIKEEFDVNKTIKVINKIIEINDGLRINIYEKDFSVYQKVNLYTKQAIEIENLKKYDENKINEIVENFKIESINMFDDILYRFKIINVDNKFGMILVKLHHIISDAWSFSKIAEEFIKMYEDREEEIKDIGSYLDYAITEKDYLQSDKFEQDKEFYKEYLANYNEKVSFKKVEEINESYQAKRYNVYLTDEQNEKISTFCKQNKISPYILFLTVFSTYMYRITGKDDFVIGSPVLGRSNFKEKQIVGMFVSTLPLRFKIEENIKLIDLARIVSIDIMKIFRHQKFPYIELLKNLRNESNFKDNLYSVLLSYQNAKIDISENDNYSTSWRFLNALSDELQIHIVDPYGTSKLSINYDYLISHFSDIEIKLMHERIMNILETFIDNIDITVDNVDILSKFDREVFENEINNTNVKYDNNLTPIKMFYSAASKYISKKALVCEDRIYTYKELLSEVNKFANYLKSFDVKQNDNIGIMMGRSERVVIAILALKSIGACYIPIDVRYPNDRIEYILNNSKCKFIIVENNEKNINFNLIEFNSLYKAIYNSEIDYNSSPDENCYMIYTSGSTGNPKGVTITNNNLTNFLIGINKHLNLKSTDNFVSVTTISFDIFELELWCSLTNGLTLVFANDDEYISNELLNNICSKNNVNIMQTTPSKLRMLLSQNGSNEYIKNMDKIIIGGERFDENLFNNLKLLNSSGQIFDVYGPTETTIWTTVKDITNTKISCGKPIDNMKVYILDSKRRELPLFIEGELAISGASVSSGYFENDEKTKNVFINTDFISDKVYLTGDLARVNFDYDIEVLNRIDNQIKINGQRVEIEEIESLILDNKKILDAAISYRDNKNLICFYSLNDKTEEFDINEVIEYLNEKLPSYMIPKVFIATKKLPYTLNNKKDRKVIDNLKVDFLENSSDIVLPKTELEKILFNLIKEVSGKEKIGINTSIRDMGIDSLDSIKIQVALLKKGIKINYTDLLKNENIENLAKYIENNEMYQSDNLSYYESVSSYDEILKNQDFNVTNKEEVKNIILTGATGFLGAHILKELLDNNKDSIIYVIAREKYGMTASDRIIDTLNYYFDGKYVSELGNRIKVLDIDILGNDFCKVLKNQVKDVNFFIHSAACVKHYGDYKYFKSINVDVTENVCKYCFENNINLIHTSTLSISGNGFDIGINNEKVKDKIFDETSLYIGQDLSNVYAKTKFDAECIVLEYMKKGLKANILRYGNLTNRTYDLKFQKNFSENAFLDRINMMIKFEKIPENLKEIYLEFTPIDFAASASVKILNNFSKNRILHIYNNHHIYLPEYIDIINKNLNVNIHFIDKKDFSNYAKSQIENSNISKVLATDLDENFNLNYKSSILVKCENTIKYLDNIGFEWEDLSEEYIINYIKYFKNLGYIKL